MAESGLLDKLQDADSFSGRVYSQEDDDLARDSCPRAAKELDYPRECVLRPTWQKLTPEHMVQALYLYFGGCVLATIVFVLEKVKSKVIA